MNHATLQLERETLEKLQGPSATRWGSSPNLLVSLSFLVMGPDWELTHQRTLPFFGPSLPAIFFFFFCHSGRVVDILPNNTLSLGYINRRGCLPIFGSQTVEIPDACIGVF